MPDSIRSSPLSSSHSSPPPPPKVSGSQKGWAIAAVVVAAIATIAFPPLLLITLPLSLIIYRKVTQVKRDDPNVIPETLKTDSVARASLSSDPSPVAPIPEFEDPLSPATSAPSAPGARAPLPPRPSPLTSSSRVYGSSPLSSTAPAAKPEVDSALLIRGKELARRGQNDAKRDLVMMIDKLNNLPESDTAGRANWQKRIESLAVHTTTAETESGRLEELGQLFASDEITTYTTLISFIEASIHDNAINKTTFENLEIVIKSFLEKIPDEPSNPIAEAFRKKLKNAVEDLATLSSTMEFDISDLIKFKEHYDPLATKLGLPPIQIDMATDHDADLAKMEQERLDEELARRLGDLP